MVEHEAGEKMAEIEVEAKAEMRTNRYGFPQPTLVLQFSAANPARDYRKLDAIGFRTAAEVEVALAAVEDTLWTVAYPVFDLAMSDQRWVNADQRRRVRLVCLAGTNNAQESVAMEALAKVAARVAALAHGI